MRPRLLPELLNDVDAGLFKAILKILQGLPGSTKGFGEPW